jgi:hypothetical protein
MTRAAALDGLPLAAVFADLRLVMSLEPSDEVPAELLRACALAWGQTQRRLSEGPGVGEGGVQTGVAEDLESRLWGTLGSPAEERPSWLVIVGVKHPQPEAPTLFSPDDLLRLAAQLLAVLLDHANDCVMLLRDHDHDEPSRVVALATGGVPRVTDVVARVRALSSLDEGLVASVHGLDAHPDGTLSRLRDLLAASS